MVNVRSCLKNRIGHLVYVSEWVEQSTLGVVTSSTRIRVLFVLLAITSGFLVYQFMGEDSSNSTPSPPELSFTALVGHIETGGVTSADFIHGSSIVTVTLIDESEAVAQIPGGFGDELVQMMLDADPAVSIDIENPPPAKRDYVGTITAIAPLILMILLIWIIWKRMGNSSGNKKFKAKTRKLEKDEQVVTFSDVAGVDEAVTELSEIKEFLSDPERFRAIGASIPKGVLLYGPPGTGKTLLARAVAGEAGVPFFTLSGSDFVEMYAGVGASRVRDLFEEAKKEAPAIIFVDEIDAVGRHRGASSNQGNEEREQTLNQLLVEMDGFDVETGVIFIAATNRPDVLDPALLRPGRFDRQVAVERPDLDGRRKIAAVHAKGKPLGADTSIDTIARRTPGFTGADIANLLNEGALLAARRRKTSIGQAELDDALDRVIAGPEKGANTLSEREKLVIAYHEAGHTLVGHVLPNTDPIHKVSIIARGKALGWTLALPEKDKVLKARSELLDEMAMLLGGRIAEEIIFSDPTTGASNDIERVTGIARSMVTDYGMSDDLGLLKFGVGMGEAYARMSAANYSNDVAERIDAEIRRLVENAGNEARELLSLHRETLDRIAAALIEHETLDAEDLAVIFADMNLGEAEPELERVGSIDLR